MANTSFSNHYQGINIDNMIGAPLVATARANSMMAREQVNFLLNHCFSSDENGYHAVMIRMSLVKNFVKNGKAEVGSVTGYFDLPLLTLIPISSLGVESLELDFALEIKSLYTKKANDESEAVLSGVIGSKSKKSTKGSEQPDQSEDSHLQVHIKAGNLPLPIGLTQIIDLYSKSVHPSEIKNQ
jgi:hypothetical protein